MELFSAFSFLQPLVGLDKGLKCPVCLLEFEEEEVVRKMPCEHIFHKGCILPWLGKVKYWNRDIPSLVPGMAPSTLSLFSRGCCC